MTSPRIVQASDRSPGLTEDDGFFDDSGRWWPSNAEWCDRCQGMGTEECDCGGDFCCCGAGDSLTCRRCDGEGYWIPTSADLAARAATAKWWRELHESLAAIDNSNSPGVGPDVEQAIREHAERVVKEGEGE